MSELLDRILGEIRERLAASRAAVLEHERLEAALHALGGTGARATRAVSGRGRGQRAPARASRPSAKRTSAATGKRPAAAPRTAERRGSAAAARRPGDASARRRGRSAGQPGRATAVRQRAPRGANRDAVLRVVGERPGLSARELAALAGVSRGTLYALLRRLTERGELEKRELPGGQAGYTLATSPPSAAAPRTPAPTGEPTPTTTPPPGPADQPDQDDTTSAPAAAGAREAAAPTQPRHTPANEPES